MIIIVIISIIIVIIFVYQVVVKTQLNTLTQSHVVINVSFRISFYRAMLAQSAVMRQ